MTDHDPLDELEDPTLAAALASLAPPDVDGDPYPAAHRHFVRRRRRHRIVTASSAVVAAAAVVLAVVVLSGGG